MSCSTRWISSSSLAVNACRSASSMGSRYGREWLDYIGWTRVGVKPRWQWRDAYDVIDTPADFDGLAASAGARIRGLHSRDCAVWRLAIYVDSKFSLRRLRRSAEQRRALRLAR
ncbi:conserved protein of unknown function [Ectopseudomonas oleovorans]|uniref:Uncharacterized protein n=1 Tax=Ectopseudomonas oleovorans TaxID=301 RepID=A0A653B564_ECTOL|nr:conserved protein of unknown function [Pseudomonas oleovorans]